MWNSEPKKCLGRPAQFPKSRRPFPPARGAGSRRARAEGAGPSSLVTLLSVGGTPTGFHSSCAGMPYGEGAAAVICHPQFRWFDPDPLSPQAYYGGLMRRRLQILSQSDEVPRPRPRRSFALPSCSFYFVRPPPIALSSPISDHPPSTPPPSSAKHRMLCPRHPRAFA